jgi:hypothetical protein
MRRCKQALSSRSQADSLMAEAQALCEELRIEPVNQ